MVQPDSFRGMDRGETPRKPGIWATSQYQISMIKNALQHFATSTWRAEVLPLWSKCWIELAKQLPHGLFVHNRQAKLMSI